MTVTAQNLSRLGAGFSPLLPFQSGCIDGQRVCSCPKCHEIGYEERLAAYHKKNGISFDWDGMSCACCAIPGKFLVQLDSGAYAIDHALFREAVHTKRLSEAR
jgi:hypothetical protein